MLRGSSSPDKDWIHEDSRRTEFLASRVLAKGALPHGRPSDRLQTRALDWLNLNLRMLGSPKDIDEIINLAYRPTTKWVVVRLVLRASVRALLVPATVSSSLITFG